MIQLIKFIFTFSLFHSEMFGGKKVIWEHEQKAEAFRMTEVETEDRQPGLGVSAKPLP